MDPMATPATAEPRPTSTQMLPDAETRPVVPVWPTAGRALGLGRSATYDAAERGDIPTIRIGRRILVATAALRQMLGLDATRGDAA